MRALLKFLLLLVIGTIVSTKITGILVARQRDHGSEVSDEFARTVIFDGLDFTSRALGLRHGEITVLVGGAQVDLREATLDAAGATLVVENTLGGVSVVVSDDWAVTVDDELVVGGDVNVDVTSPIDLPEDAPKLHIELLTRLAGSSVSTAKVEL